MNAKTIMGMTTRILLVLTLLVVASAAQDKPAQKADAPPQPQQVSSGKEYLGPTADSIRPYRSSGRDPFKKAVKPKTARGKSQQTRASLF